MKTKMLLVLWVIGACRIFMAEYLPAYEVLTHQRLTRSAFEKSVLNQVNIWQQLGFPIDQTFQGLDSRRWLEMGSIREDDYFSGALFRFKNHFYDPAYNRGLTHSHVSGERAFEWALEETRTFSLQDFSWRDARQYFLMGLTAPFPAVRDRNMALTFRTLGQIVHLVQDMGSPEHTRNDIHAGFPRFGLGAPSIFEKHIDQIRNSLDYTSYKPPSFAKREDFWRTGDGRGFAEFTNLNFISKSTNFTRTENGAMGVGYFLPQLRLDLNENVDVQALPGVYPTLTGKVTFFGNSVYDAITEQNARNSRMTTHSLFDSDLRKKGEAEIFTVNRFTVEAAAPFLISRAVGYSTGLIDYFFRGKLDVDIFDDPTDASLVRLEGKNGSTEKLDGGKIELYGEDPKGVRTAATPVGGNVVFADPGQPISLSFRLPPNSDKLMAVYKGKLGNETPQGDFIGAVIGKSISPQRVEQIFTDYTRWYIRNPQGVFPLPLLKSEVDDLQWGDSDNMMVGRSRIGPAQPNMFYTYRINRLLGATHIPLTATQEVDIQPINQYSFPMGVSIGTNVQFTHVMPYKQYLLTMITTNVLNWEIIVPDDPNIPGDQSSGLYIPEPQNIVSDIQLMVDASGTKALNYPIVLDENSHLLGPRSAQYLWDIWNIHLTGDGRPLALIQVQFTTNNLGEATFPARTLSVETGSSGDTPPEVIDLPEVRVPFALPEIGPTWVLVDVSTGAILANTAPANLLMTHTNGFTSYNSSNPRSAPLVRKLLRTRYNGGDQEGYTWSAPINETLAPNSVAEMPYCTESRLKQMNVLASLSINPSHIQTTLTQNRQEIAQMEFGAVPNSPGGHINFPAACGNDEEPAEGFRISVSPGSVFAPNRVGEFGAGVIRTTPVAGTERLIFLMSQAQTSSIFSQRTKMIAWNPALSRVDSVQEFNDQALHALITASQDAALFVTISNDENQSRLIDFPAASVTAFPNQLLFDYALLDPAYFYNTSDFKFHVKDSSLASTGTPPSLAPAPTGNPRGRYHLLKAKGPVN